MPWTALGVNTALGLDIAYEGQHSCQKFVAPIIYNWLDEDGKLTSTGMDNLCAALKAKYLQKWAHLWSLYSAEYGPLDTLSIRETGSRQSTKTGTGTDTTTIDDSTTRSATRTDNLTESSSGSDNTTNGGTDTTTNTHGATQRTDQTGSESTEHRVSGFNSTQPVNATQDVRTPTLTEQITNGGSDTSALQHGHTENRALQSTVNNTGTQTNAETEAVDGSHVTQRSLSDTGTETYTNTRTGTFRYAPAELMEMDRAFWLDGYFSIIFDDLDDFLCLRIYPERIPNTSIFS